MSPHRTENRFCPVKSRFSFLKCSGWMHFILFFFKSTFKSALEISLTCAQSRPGLLQRLEMYFFRRPDDGSLTFLKRCLKNKKIKKISTEQQPLAAILKLLNEG